MPQFKKDLITQLEDLIVRDDGFQELERALNYFCPFEAIGMVDQEIRHAHFLSYILDPKRPHGFEDAYLRAFLHVAAEKTLDKSAPLRPIDIHLMSLGDALIARERGRIDLRIEIPASKATSHHRVVLIFELKVNAGEREGQLRRYMEDMEREYSDAKLAFYFLTLDGDDPSETSRDDWYPLSMRDIIDKFDQASKRPIGDEEAQSTVRAYISMMRRKHLGNQNDRLRDLARRLWDDHKEALEYLRDTQPDDVSDILGELHTKVDSFCGRLREQTGLHFATDRDSSSRTIILFPHEFDHLNIREDESRLFVLVVDRNYGDRDKLRFRWLIRPGDADKRAALYSRIDGKKRKLTGDWTQIAVQRMNLAPESNVEDIEREIIAFVKAHEPRMEKLRSQL